MLGIVGNWLNIKNDFSLLANLGRKDYLESYWRLPSLIFPFVWMPNKGFLPHCQRQRNGFRNGWDLNWSLKWTIQQRHLARNNLCGELEAEHVIAFTLHQGPRGSLRGVCAQESLWDGMGQVYSCPICALPPYLAIIPHSETKSLSAFLCGTTTNNTLKNSFSSA